MRVTSGKTLHPPFPLDSSLSDCVGQNILLSEIGREIDRPFTKLK